MGKIAVTAATTEASQAPTFATTPFQKERAKMLSLLLRKGSVGAELGVFRGEFSVSIIRAVTPSELYLVDPWDLAYGETYPDWGDYTERGTLPTARALAETASRMSSQDMTRVHIVKDYSQSWLPKMPDAYFDWIYLDSTHNYDDTVKELELCRRKVKPEGVICGHDFETNPKGLHHAVFRAVTELTRKGEYELIWAGPHQQWAVRRSVVPVHRSAEARRGPMGRIGRAMANLWR